ncbi:MAG: acyl-CoA dehydrogenase family protein, partial [Acidimicrobiales bacterium]
PLLLSISPEASSTWLPLVASGQAVLAVGHEASPYVSDAHIADLLLLQWGDEVHAVAPDAVALTRQPSIDGARRLFTVSWQRSDSTRLAEGARARAALDAAFDRAALASAAQLLGLADRLVALAAAHARQRHQFGRPIGSFQAVKHLLADALLALEFARPCTYRAAFSIAHEDPDRAVHVSMAKAYASDAASLAARVALQVHGAIGYTWEHDLHLYMKKAWALASAWGDSSWHRRRVAEALGL